MSKRFEVLLVVCFGSALAMAAACGSTPQDDEGDDDEIGDGGLGFGGTSRGGRGAAGSGRGGSGGTDLAGQAGEEATGGTSSGGTDTGGTNTGGASGSMNGGTNGGGQGGTGTSGGGSGGSGVSGSEPGGSAGSGGSGTGGSGGSSGSGGSGCPAPCLVHRYSFNESGTVVTDSVGTAHGTAIGCSLSASGVTMAGGTSDQYVDLPDGIIASLTNATFETWVTWGGGASYWQRIFDFGSSTSGVGQGTEGVTYLFLTPRTSQTQRLRVAFSSTGPLAETFVDAAAALPSVTMTHVAVVVSDTAKLLSLYVNGATSGTPAPFNEQLTMIQSVNAWLGRSQFLMDDEFNGTIHEFRIYGVARSAAEVLASYTAGPDTLPTQ